MDYKKLTEDLREARRAALVAAGANPEDGGTCNFDTPVLFVKRARLSSLEKAAAEVGGIRISKWGRPDRLRRRGRDGAPPRADVRSDRRARADSLHRTERGRGDARDQRALARQFPCRFPQDQF